ncbi:cytochrome P450 [Streptomyces sp. B1866]|uniref:cytochrome P450 family protein n=1 Tax=Streptomyces sp. B1866 TaxID=3075431 RepID=UPI00288FF2B7|nr:cytochrome P450 [Streptomyces sp. B1866]MDT3395974.1 cytochrome P450 [Streptomyces sp. B1866]
MVAWALTRQSVIKQLFTDPRVSKDPRRHWPRWINGEIAPDWPLITWVAVQNMFTAYGSDHTRLRSLVATAFTARRTAAMRPRVERITTGLLDTLAATPDGAVVDLRETYAVPLPVQVICELFGVPDGTMRDTLRRCADSIFHTAAASAEVTATYEDIYAVLAELVAYKRARPDDDLTSGLIAARENGTSLSEQELADTLLLVISAGYETTVNLLDNAVHALLADPEQLGHVHAGRATWNDVIEETLRRQPPGATLPLRYAVEDIELDGGVVIRKGDAIIAALASAGRDPDAVGPDADRFDVTRQVKDHLAFGHGVHRCLGAPLARLEAAVALPALFERFPALALAAPASDLLPLESFISNGHRTLPVRLR